MKNRVYHIEIEINDPFEDWMIKHFETLKMTLTDSGNAIIKGTLEDASAVFGCVLMLRDLGLSFNKIHIKQS